MSMDIMDITDITDITMDTTSWALEATCLVPFSSRSQGRPGQD